MKSISELINFGLINIDKPAGPTSFSISNYVRKKLGLNKTSHMGTLDPMVTGVLPITLGRACRLASYFIHHDKGYEGILHTHKPQEVKELQKLIDDNFVGKIKQIPPHKSAVKRAERERTVHSFKFSKEIDSRNFPFTCLVEGGTYIRKICSDLGEKIGGAHMSKLRRTSAGIFDTSKIYTLEEFNLAVEEYLKGKEETLSKMIVPAEEAVKKVLPFVEVKKNAIKALFQGKPLFKEDIKGEILSLNVGEPFSVFQKEEFIGVYKKTNENEIFGRAEFVKQPF